MKIVDKGIEPVHLLFYHIATMYDNCTIACTFTLFCVPLLTSLGVTDLRVMYEGMCKDANDPVVKNTLE